MVTWVHSCRHTFPITQSLTPLCPRRSSPHLSLSSNLERESIFPLPPTFSALAFPFPPPPLSVTFHRPHFFYFSLTYALHRVSLYIYIPPSPLATTFAVAMANFLDLLDLTYSRPCPSLLLHQYTHFAAMDDLLLLPAPSPFLVFESAVDLFRIDHIRSLSDRVAALELGVGRKYKWTAEVEEPERKYKCVAEVKAGKVLPERKFKWTAEFKGKGAGGPFTKTYTFESSASPAGGGVGKVKKGKDEKKEKKEKVVLVEVEDVDPPALALKQVSRD